MKRASAEGSQEALIEALKCFKCCKDPDVQDFLNNPNKAINFEKSGRATTYLLLSKEKFSNGELLVEGYFSLTHKAVVYSRVVSKTSRQKLSGKKAAKTESFILIGQLGKRIDLNEKNKNSVSSLTINDILRDAISIIKHSSNYIICRNIIVECKPIPNIKHLYEKNGFTELQQDQKTQLHTLYLRLPSDINFNY